MKLFRSILIAFSLSLLTATGASAQCGTTAPANKFCGNDSGASGLASWKSVPTGAMSAIAGGTVIGNATAASAVPTATTAPVLGIPGTSTGQIGLAGSTSGTAILRAQAAAGSAVVLLPTSAGTLAASASSPLVLNATSGLLTCPTCVTSSGGGAITGTAPISVSAGGVVSINAPYTTLTASNGGIVYSGAANLAILGGTATARQMLQSGASAAPAWSTSTWPATTTANQILFSSSANTVGEITTGNNGVLVTSGGGVPSISTTLPTGLAMQTPASITLTNATGLPVLTGISGAGTGVLTALSTNVGNAGSVVVNGGVLGTPSSGVGTNLTALNASNLSSGTVAAARGGAGTINGVLAGNGAGVVSQGTCAGLSGSAASCSTDTTNASNISSGTLAAARGGAGTITGALKGNGAGVVSQATCSDISGSAASCSTDTTNASNISSGTLATARGGVPQGAWTSFTTGTACAAGSPTFTSSSRWQQIAPKTTLVQYDITVTAISTCDSSTNTVSMNLPNTAASTGGSSAYDFIGGAGMFCWIPTAGSTQVSCRSLIGTGLNKLVTSSHMVFSMVYENQ